MKQFFRPQLFVQLLSGSLVTAAVTIGVGVLILLITTRIEERTDTIVNRLTPLSVLSANFEKNLNLALVVMIAGSENPDTNRQQIISERSAIVNGLDLLALKLEREAGQELRITLREHLNQLEANISKHDVGFTEEERLAHVQRLRSALSFAEGLNAFVHARFIGEEFELQADTNQLRRIWLVTFAVLVIFGVSAAAFFSWRLSRKVQGMLRGAHEFSKGNFDYRINSRSRDELGELASQLDAMADKIGVLTASVQVLKTELLSTASHQLLTPLTRVRWTINEVQEKLSDAGSDVKKKLSVLYTTTVRMIEFVLLVLDASKLEGEGMYFDIKSVSLKSILDSVKDDVETNAKKVGVHFVVEPVDPAIMIAADATYIQQVFQNLADNALRYTPKSGTVTIQTKVSGNFVATDVIDTGIGIPETERDKIFKKFFRATNAQKTVSSGNGLGLFISNTIVTGHGGTITFKSKEGTGTTFTVRLPVSGSDEVQAG